MDIPEVKKVPKPAGGVIRYGGRDWEDLTVAEQQYMTQMHNEMASSLLGGIGAFVQTEDGRLVPFDDLPEEEKAEWQRLHREVQNS